MVTHCVTMLEKHLVFTGETAPRNFTTNRAKKRSIKPEDPMSHRIIEKRRRDRMNNCLADLSRLIPPEYLKKGRGRIEKTEIIEMAIKHMRHLQNIIASTRFAENSDNSMPSPPTTSTVLREAPTSASEQPIIIEHYRLGYLECLSEAMHFLVEVQGYFAGDSLCVQMINHLHKHCDKILKGSNLNFPKKHTGETASSDSSTSPVNGTFNNSPPLGMSNSTCSASDDNQPNQNFEGGRQFEDGSKTFQDGYRSPRRYSEACYSSNNPKRNSEGCCPRYVESEGVENERPNENRSDSELNQNFVLKCKNNDVRKDEPKSYLNNFESASNLGHRTYSVTNGILANLEDSSTYENISLKEENVNGPSQLREMLTSPSSMCAQLNGHCSRNTMEGRGNTSPMSNTSGCETLSGPLTGVKSQSTCLAKNLNFKFQSLAGDSNEGNSNFSEGLASDNHHMMYKFKNNIKQRFSKEKRENPEYDMGGDQPSKKARANEDHQKYPDPLMKERLNLLDRTDVEEEKVFKFNADFEIKKRNRYGSESETQDGDISNRLSFGHKSMDKAKRWEDTVSSFPHQNNQKLWTLSPNASVPFCQAPIGCKVSGRPVPEYSSAMNNSFNNLSISTSDLSPGIPIFALHAKGSFYIPLTLDHATLAPFLTILGVTKTDEGVEEKTVLHPVTISVNFQSHLVR